MRRWPSCRKRSIPRTSASPLPPRRMERSSRSRSPSSRPWASRNSSSLPEQSWAGPERKGGFGRERGEPSMDWKTIREEGLKDFSMAAIPPTIELPALPHAVTAFMDKSADESVDMKDLADILETDTGLTFELLKHVNSSFMALRQQAKSVFQAISLLGRRQSRMLVFAKGTEAAMRARKSKLINQAAFWNASLQKALFAREVADLLKADRDVAFSGALLQDYLLPVLTNDLFQTYLDFIQSREQSGETLSEFETKRMGWDHSLAGACLAHCWHLPDELVCC